MLRAGLLETLMQEWNGDAPRSEGQIETGSDIALTFLHDARKGYVAVATLRELIQDGTQDWEELCELVTHSGQPKGKTVQ